MKFKDISPGLVLSVSLELKIADHDDLLAGRLEIWSIYEDKSKQNCFGCY